MALTEQLYLAEGRTVCSWYHRVIQPSHLAETGSILGQFVRHSSNAKCNRCTGRHGSYSGDPWFTSRPGSRLPWQVFREFSESL